MEFADLDPPGRVRIRIWERGVGPTESSPLVQDGVVKALNVEAPGKFEVSDADTMLKQA